MARGRHVIGGIRYKTTGPEMWVKAVESKDRGTWKFGRASGPNSTGASGSQAPFLSLWSFNSILCIFTGAKEETDLFLVCLF